MSRKLFATLLLSLLFAVVAGNGVARAHGPEPPCLPCVAGK